MIYLTAFAASFVFVFLKAFQQRSVAFLRYKWVFPTSLAMAATEVYVVVNVAQAGWNLVLVLAIGSGAGIGAILAMLIHNKWVMKNG